MDEFVKKLLQILEEKKSNAPVERIPDKGIEVMPKELELILDCNRVISMVTELVEERKGKIDAELKDDYAFTWNDLYMKAIESGFGTKEHEAKESAMVLLKELIKFHKGIDIEKCEHPDVEIDGYLYDENNKVLFNKDGVPLESNYLITVDAEYIRDTQVFSPHEEFDFLHEDIHSMKHEGKWHDMPLPLFVGIVRANSISCARKLAAETYNINFEVLRAIRI